MVGSAKTEKDADKSLTSYARQKSRVNKAQLCNDLKSGKRYCFLVTQAPLLRNLYACKALQGQVIAFDELRSSTQKHVWQNQKLYFALPFALTSYARQRPYKTQFCIQFGKARGGVKLGFACNVKLFKNATIHFISTVWWCFALPCKTFGFASRGYIAYASLHRFTKYILQELDEMKVSCPARKTSFHLGMRV